jgi:hypothetical protein
MALIPKSAITIGFSIALGCLFGIVAFVGGYRLLDSTSTSQEASEVNAVVTPAKFAMITAAPEIEKSSWATYEDKNHSFTLKYPPEVTIDERQTSAGRITVFVFEEDAEKELPGKVYMQKMLKRGMGRLLFRIS